MYGTVTRILEEIDHWRDNSSTGDTLDSLTSVETLIIKIHEMNHAIKRGRGCRHRISLYTETADQED